MYKSSYSTLFQENLRLECCPGGMPAVRWDCIEMTLHVVLVYLKQDGTKPFFFFPNNLHIKT